MVYVGIFEGFQRVILNCGGSGGGGIGSPRDVGICDGADLSRDNP